MTVKYSSIAHVSETKHFPGGEGINVCQTALEKGKSSWINTSSKLIHLTLTPNIFPFPD